MFNLHSLTQNGKLDILLLKDVTILIVPHPGDSLLHMSVSSGSALRSNSFLDDETLPPFPCSVVTSFFVDISAGNVGQRNATLETPLHMACKPENFSKDVVKVRVEMNFWLFQFLS